MEEASARVTFMEELFEFLQSRGVPKPKVPMIGGKELDLFTLYNSVINRGGAENVSANKLWKEIVNEFELPPSCTSASFTLKNHYQKYLLAFEQKFFFKKEDPEMLTELANQRKKLKESQFLLKREEPSAQPSEHRSEHSFSLRENLLRAYGDKVKSAEEVYCVNRNSLVPSANEIKRIVLAFECLIPAEIRYALNSLLMYSCSKVSPFFFDNYRVLYNSFEGYLLEVSAHLEHTRYFLMAGAGLRDERLIGDESDRLAAGALPFPVAELLEQFKLMLTVVRNLVFSAANEEFFAKDSRLIEILFGTFIRANEGEVFRLVLEIYSVLSRHLLLKSRKTEEERLFIGRLVESLFSEHECELGIENLHNLMMNQENEAVIESQLPRFVEILIRLLISGTVEIVERVLEIICYFSDLKISTRMLLARQPNFFPRLIALVAGKTGGSNEKIARVSLMIISNIMVTSAARVYLKPLEKDIFLISTVDESVSESLCQILEQLKDEKEKGQWKAHNQVFYEKYLKGDFFCAKKQPPANVTG